MWTITLGEAACSKWIGEFTIAKRTNRCWANASRPTLLDWNTSTGALFLICYVIGALYDTLLREDVCGIFSPLQPNKFFGNSVCILYILIFKAEHNYIDRRCIFPDLFIPCSIFLVIKRLWSKSDFESFIWGNFCCKICSAQQTRKLTVTVAMR